MTNTKIAHLVREDGLSVCASARRGKNPRPPVPGFATRAELAAYDGPKCEFCIRQ